MTKLNKGVTVKKLIELLEAQNKDALLVPFGKVKGTQDIKITVDISVKHSQYKLGFYEYLS